MRKLQHRRKLREAATLWVPLVLGLQFAVSFLTFSAMNPEMGSWQKLLRIVDILTWSW